MPTVAQINEKTTELRSKIAVTECTVLYLKTNYLSSKDGKGNDVRPEMFITRGDYGMVPELHIQAAISDYVDYIDQLRLELQQWEQMSVQLPEPRVLRSEKKKPRIEKKTNATGSEHKNNPAPQDSGSAKTG